MRPVPHTSRLERTCTKSLRFVAVGCGNDFECRDGDDGDGGGGWRGGVGVVVVVGWIKDMREASSEFDSVIAQTSETVTRGVSFLPQRRLPRAGAVFFLYLSLSPSVTQSPAKNSAVHSLHGPNWVTFTKVYKIHL